MPPFPAMNLEQYPETFGCEVEDVLRLLPGVSFREESAPAPGVSNPLYQAVDSEGNRTGRKLSREDIAAFIRQVATRVRARLWRFDQTPDRFREHVETMAGDLVANGAASYAQAALFPAGVSTNDQSGYAAVLWARFQAELDDMATQVDDVLDNPSVDPGGSTSSGFPAPFFPDEMVF